MRAPLATRQASLRTFRDFFFVIWNPMPSYIPWYMVQCTCSFYVLMYREGLYVRVAGHLRSFNDSSRSVLAFMIQPVADFNEITMHMLEVIHAHLYLKKGASLAPKQENKMVRDRLCYFLLHLLHMQLWMSSISFKHVFGMLIAPAVEVSKTAAYRQFSSL